jgi:hypothetical protein
MTIEIQLSPTPNPERQTRRLPRNNGSLQFRAMFSGMVAELQLP